MKWNYNILFAALGVVSSLVGSSGVAQADPSDRPAYEAAMKCFVVIGNAAGERERAGDAAKAATYKIKAHSAFDLAVKFGKSLGISGQQMTSDFQATQDRELRRLIEDVDYNRQSAADCRALGLL